MTPTPSLATNSIHGPQDPIRASVARIGLDPDAHVGSLSENRDRPWHSYTIMVSNDRTRCSEHGTIREEITLSSVIGSRSQFSTLISLENIQPRSR